MIQSIQKIIKIGTSAAVTIPAKELRRQSLSYGDEVKVTIEAVEAKDKHQRVIGEYNRFIEQYGSTLKSLANK